jgi:non-heme chloroperoxidase
MQTQYTVRGGAGLPLNVLEWGNARGPSVLFIHGWSQSYLCWQKQYDSALAEHFRLVAFDLRGHGLSGAPNDPDCYNNSVLWAADVQAIIETLHLGRTVLVGWSYGSFVIADYLAVHGADAVAGINLVGGAVRFGEQAIGTYIGAGSAEPFPRAVSPDLNVSIDAMREFIAGCFAVKLSREDYERVLCFNMLTRADVRAALMARPLEADSALRAFKGPLLVSHGRLDTIVLPATAELIKALCPQAQLSWYDQAGHGPFIEAPQRFNDELAEFVRAVQT